MGEAALSRRFSAEQAGVALVTLSVMALCAIFPSVLSRWAIPSCYFKFLTTLNCPFCGMTRDFLRLLQGRYDFLNPSFVPFMIVLLLNSGRALYSFAVKRTSPIVMKEKVVLAILLTMFLLNNVESLERWLKWITIASKI